LWKRRGEQQSSSVRPLYRSSRGKGRKFTEWGGARGRIPHYQDVETYSPSNMQPFTITTHTTEAYQGVIKGVGIKEGSGVGSCTAYTTWRFRVSLLSRLRIHCLLGVCLSYLLASFVLYYLTAPFRRCGSRQESTPILLLFLRHNTS